MSVCNCNVVIFIARNILNHLYGGIEILVTLRLGRNQERLGNTAITYIKLQFIDLFSLFYCIRLNIWSSNKVSSGKRNLVCDIIVGGSSINIYAYFHNPILPYSNSWTSSSPNPNSEQPLSPRHNLSRQHTTVQSLSHPPQCYLQNNQPIAKIEPNTQDQFSFLFEKIIN